MGIFLNHEKLRDINWVPTFFCLKANLTLSIK